MKFPMLSEMYTSRDMVDVFGGYNHNLRIGSGEFYDMQNLTSNYYPVLSPRGKRGVYKKEITPKAMVGKDALCYLEGTNFVMNQKSMNIGLWPYETAQLISMGAYVVILTKDAAGNPVDAKWVNTNPDTNDEELCGDIEAEYESVDGNSVKFTLAKVDGETYGKADPSDIEPPNPKNGDLWLDTSSVPCTLKQYSSTLKT